MKPTPIKALVVKQDNSITQNVNALFASKTPQEFIKSRPGPSGLVIKYVQIGYVINQLNKAFGPFWEFSVVDKQVGKKQIWVQGRLTVKDMKTGFSITKETFGGADIKISKTTQEAIDIANDLKAAVSDCTKKCASMFGIAADIFFKEQNQYDQEPAILNVEEGEAESTRKIVLGKLMAIAGPRGFTDEIIHSIILKKYDVSSRADLSVVQLEELVSAIENNYQLVSEGSRPLKKGTEGQEQHVVPSPETSKTIESEGEDETVGVSGTGECRNCGSKLGSKSYSLYFCEKKCSDEYWKPKKNE